MPVRRVAAARRRLGRLVMIGRTIAHGGRGTLAAAAVVWRPQLTAAALVGAAALAVRGRRWPPRCCWAPGCSGRRGGRARGAAPVRRAGPGRPHRALGQRPARARRHGRARRGRRPRDAGRVVLPEGGTDYRDKLVPLLAGLGYRSWVSTDPGTPDGRGVVLLAAERAGDVRVRRGTGMRLRHLELTGGVLGDRTLYAVHTTAPMGRSATAWWHAELDLIGRWTRASPAPVVVGDLNATFDHAPLRAALGGCRSAAAGTGRGLVGTFPSAFPRWLGIQIDHVLVPAGTTTSHFAVLDVPGTDHRAILTRVHLP
ncbi:hypothetical protein BJF78_21005 [Pseudonocardia sp. CNS-139]|nr:hypothetical protein BJF78_21005 [Pseudonocardia sp. CNS-139]